MEGAWRILLKLSLPELKRRAALDDSMEKLECLTIHRRRNLYRPDAQQQSRTI
jgi:hypothetical protein